jgi:hypothetical protein
LFYTYKNSCVFGSVYTPNIKRFYVLGSVCEQKIKILFRECLGKEYKKLLSVAYPGILFRGVQQIQLRTEGRENGDLGAVAP